MNQLIAAIDQGTTSTRAMIFNRDAEILANRQLPHEQIFPRPGWVEHDPLEISAKVRETLAAAIADSGRTLNDIAAIGITNQRETTVVWNRETGKPYLNAIVWQDTRTGKLCDQLSRRIGGIDRFRARTGLPISVYFSAIKLRWLFDEVEGLIDEARAGRLLFGTIDSWLIWNLTGGVDGGNHLTDVTNASRTMMMNLETLDWDDEILAELDIPRAVLPEIRPSASFFGTAKLDGHEIPIRAVFGDQHAALFGQNCFRPGEGKNTYGTGCFLLMNTGSTAIRSENGLITTVGYQLDGQPPIYALEGSIAMTGALVQWLRDNLGLIQRSEEIESLARSVEDNGDVYIVPAFSGLFAPYWRSDARGVFAGLTRFTNRGHIARAILESTAFQVMEVVEAMRKDSGVNLTSLKVDGGMTVNELLMQFQSDILDVPIVRPKNRESTALGAAFGAGLSAGIWRTTEELARFHEIDRVWKPDIAASRRLDLCMKWRKAVTKSFGWIDET